LAWIKVPSPTDDELSRVYKISKRFEDDISAVCLAIRLRLQDGLVREASIGVGGVAATPVRAVRTQAALRGQRWSQQAAQAAAVVLRGEFAPISDMRASAAYRSEVLGNLLQRFWMESQGLAAASLESLDVEALPS
jgi:xanthine dehydrogenase small subunit